MITLYGRRLRSVTMGVAVSLTISTSIHAANRADGGPQVGTAAPADSVLGSSDPSVAALVPDSYKKKGILTIAVSATHPPNAFFNDQNKLVGWEVELGTALAAHMGLEPNFQKVQFAEILTGLQSGRYDMGLSGINDNKTREKVLTFVDYFSAGTSLVVHSGDPKHISSIKDLCGRTVAIETGTNQVGIAQDQSKKCTEEGKEPVEVKLFPDETQVQLQIRTGRAAAGLNDFPVAAYIAQQSQGQLEAVRGGKEFNAPYGLAISKNSPELVKAVQAALKDVIADGTYAKILKEWNLEQGALTTAEINGATQ